MSDTKEQLQRAQSQFPPPEGVMESLRRRRDRKRRNQRVAAGVVGIAFFVAAVLAVTTVGSSDRTQTPADDGPDPSDPPCVAWSQSPLGCWFDGLPPEEAVPSTRRGDVIAQSTARHGGFVYVYADGRVLVDATWERPGTIVERRLTPENLQRVRSGELNAERLVGLLQLPPAWEGEGRVYVAPRYAICYMNEEGNVIDPSGDLSRLLPPQVEALLSGKERTYDHVAGAAGGSIPTATCFEVTLDEARALDEVLTSATVMHDSSSEQAFERVEGGRGELAFVPVDRGTVVITFNALLPHDEWIARE